MKRKSALRRGLLPKGLLPHPGHWMSVLALVLTALASRGQAAPPANDLCAGAELIPRSDPFP